MQIELTGPTMAGKSTLARSIQALGRENGIDIVCADTFILGRFGLNRIGSRLARTVLIDMIALASCLAHWHRYRRFLSFALGAIRALTAPVATKANLARNVLKKVGIHAFISARDGDGSMVLIDEGTLHAAHNLFVHEDREPDLDGLATFVSLVPRPHMAIHITLPQSAIRERLVHDGHKRISGDLGAKRFARRAVEVSDILMQNPDLRQTIYVATIDGSLGDADRDRAVLQALRHLKPVGDPVDGRQP